MKKPVVYTPLRYPGGKSKSIKKIIDFFNLEYDEYREPFLGGGSVFIYLKQMFPDKKYWINDINYNLYCFWWSLQNKNDSLIDILLYNKLNKDPLELHNESKEFLKNPTDNKLTNAVYYFISNKTSYSGLEIGKYSKTAVDGNFTINNIEKLSFLKNILKDVKITNLDYTELLSYNDDKKLFMYLYPPYELNKKQKNVLYGLNGSLHKSFNHEDFYNNIDKNYNYNFCISYNDDDYILKRFDKFNHYFWNANYTMNWGNDNKSKKKREVLITNYKN